MEHKQLTIPYGGVTTSPEDWLCKDGDLAVCQNLINEEGGIKALGTAQTCRTFEGGGQCVFIHENDTYTHYLVIFDTGDVGYYDGQEGEECIYIGTLDGTFKSACALGNVLITLTDEEMHYYLWKDESYIDLGSKLPEINIRFTNSGYFDKSGNVVDVDTDNDGTGTPMVVTGVHTSAIRPRSHDMYIEGPSYSISDFLAQPYPNANVEVRTSKEDYTSDGGKDYPTLMTNRCWSCLNQALDDCKQQGLFVFPKLLRAAWRMYDGTYAMFTSPVLMYNMGTQQPLALEGRSDKKNIASRIYPYTIDYWLDLSGYGGLESFIATWGDLIKGLTIFAGSDILDYDGEGKITEIRRTYHSTESEDTTDEDDESVITTESVSDWHYSAAIPRPTNEDMIESIKSGSPFYKVLDSDLEDMAETDGYAVLVVHRVNTHTTKLDAVAAQTIVISGTLGGDGWEVTLAIPANSTVDTIFDLIEETFKETGITPHKMHIGRKRMKYNANVTNRESYRLGLALTAKGRRVAIATITTTETTGTLDVYGWNAYGTPLTSDKMPLTALESQTSINDDYLQHFTLLPGTLNVYNNRLNMGALEVTFGAYQYTRNASDINAGALAVRHIHYYIDTNNGEVVSQSYIGTTGAPCDMSFLYYPDSRCAKAVVDTENGLFELPMEPSNVLNGSVFVLCMPHHNIVLNDDQNGYEFAYNTNSGITRYALGSYTYPSNIDQGVEHLDNVVLTTKVDNPLNWDASGEASVGNGKVLALVANTTALSEGQFGSHPMYAFTDSEGVWALAITTDGQMSAVQPVCRDTLTDPKSICQLDRSVVFATARGLVNLSGSQTQCISQDLDGTAFDTDSLPHYAEVLTAMFGEVRAADIDLATPAAGASFKTFCQGCRIAYDHTNQRLMVWNTGYGHAYVYSIKTATWGLRASNYLEPLNSYPEALVTTTAGTIVNLSAEEENNTTDSTTGTTSPGFILTRPLKLGAPGLLKTLYKAFQRGRLRHDAVSQALWASRDLCHWVLVDTSATMRLTDTGGTPYRYFIVAVGCNLRPDERLHALSIQYGRKYLNRMR